MNPLAQIGAEREVIAPGAVDQASMTDALGVDHGLLARSRDERCAALRLLLPDVRQISYRARIACRRSISCRCCSSTTAA